MAVIGIRREDKSPFERRAPLPPDKVSRSIERHGIEFVVQPSPNRVFSDSDYAKEGAKLQEDLARADLIMGVKEVPSSRLLEGKAYLFFSHTIKGQEYNMPMLRALMKKGCTLLDYERIVDPDTGKRLVFFGIHAGLAGMIDSFWALGRRLEQEGLSTPFSRVRQALAYRDLDEVRADFRKIGRTIAEEGLPPSVTPLVVGFTGYGNVSQGAQQISDLLPTVTVTPEELAALRKPGTPSSRNCVYKVVFREEHMATTRDGSPFVLKEYFRAPERFVGIFSQWLEHLTVLVNCIYWEPRYPRLVTRSNVRQLHHDGRLNLKVIGDITCDIDGSIELTTEATGQEKPILVYDPVADTVENRWDGEGVAVLAVDNLPAELPRDATGYFGESLFKFLPALAGLDRSQPFEKCPMPDALRPSVIVWNGELTPPYRYLQKFLNATEVSS